jgi:hypothetical protein
MRVFLAATGLLVVVLVGFSVRAPAASAQDVMLGQAGIREGEKVRLISEPDRGAFECTVIGLQGDFLGCRTERPGIGQPTYTRWYNLRLIVRIDRPARQE